MRISRREFVSGLSVSTLTGAGLPAMAQTRLASSDALVSAAQLGGDVGFIALNARTGQVIEQRNPQTALPPASTAKAITSLYALETLGPDYRFGTRLYATGPISGGVIQGDLVLAGGADPTLSTDDLGAMASTLVAQGVRGVTGRFLVWSGAIPYTAAIDPDQPVYAGYNPAVSGLILNYNRVYFGWKRASGGWQLTMDARGNQYKPTVYTTSMSITNRAAPLYSYSDRGGKEAWTVSAAALGNGGSRWLPVRHPAAYAGDVFQTLARAAGCPLPAPQEVSRQPGGTVLVTHGSQKLSQILHDMMKYSTNITAEAVGMSTSAARGVPAGRGKSGAAMSAWLQARAGGGKARFVDHSGLGADARVSPMDMVRALANVGQPMGLRSLMKPFQLRDAQGRKRSSQPFRVDAKTGTLNFVSTLAGYMTAPSGTEIVFAIYTGDVARRARTSNDAQPAGNVQWVRRSKILQTQLLERWAALA
ncbi:D-alanyl-D-alanine carboxypeptidase/D-alanyl-D-alanine-endopeptidase [Rhodobacteraceae bacterium]|nr:D-alanyl-D-alanine carboxypeptidase/D-alanyl-D-alanine-endopeptidase [Paracoccaceae bacterium]